MLRCIFCAELTRQQCTDTLIDEAACELSRAASGLTTSGLPILNAQVPLVHILGPTPGRSMAESYGIRSLMSGRTLVTHSLLAEPFRNNHLEWCWSGGSIKAAVLRIVRMGKEAHAEAHGCGRVPCSNVRSQGLGRRLQNALYVAWVGESAWLC